MAISAEYKAFVAEQLEPLGPVRIRNMFGGAGVYCDDLMFGLIAGETSSAPTRRERGQKGDGTCAIGTVPSHRLKLGGTPR